MGTQLQLILCQLRRALEGLYGLRLSSIVLFGSQARGTAVSGSDIDILIVLNGSMSPGQEIRRVSKITASISLQHNDVISSTFVSADRFASEQSPLLINVRREGIPV